MTASLVASPLRSDGIPALSRLRLAALPTPLQAFPRLGDAIGSRALSVKREDLSGLGLGGNKPRQIEVILGAAAKAGCNAIVTTAGAQSNFCRVMAAACAELGWRCVLLLRGAPPPQADGNLLLDRLFGADIHWIDTQDPYADAIQERLEALAEDLRRDGAVPHIVRLPGATGPLAAAAAVGLADELIEQWDRPASHVVIAAGSGLTAAGLLAGFARAGLATRVLTVSVQQPASFIAPLILKRAAEALELLATPASIDPARLHLDDSFIGPGYGIPSEASMRSLRIAGRTGGLVLDPAYTAKALAALTAYLADGRIGADEPVTFIHTGGAPGLFARAAAVSSALAS
jgi:1-aminocyclopropane-1-carboxylate deaminase/D-cysteine desulfhydrase-like pyridoxal-dependent ACC family enzyme